MKLPQILAFILLFCSASSTLESSMLGAERFLQAESSIIKIFQSFIYKTEQRIKELKTQIERLEKEHNNTRGYTSDPYNTFRLINRVINEWRVMEDVLLSDVIQEFEESITELKRSDVFPTEKDLKASAEALNIICEVYNIDIRSVANGNVNGIQYPSQLSANECLEMGIQSYANEVFWLAYFWMDEALKRFHIEGNKVNSFREEDALAIKGYSAYKIGDYISALKITTELLHRFPENKHAAASIEYYKYIINSGRTEKEELTEYEAIDREWVRSYKELCSKTISPAEEINSKLKCSYINNGVPFLRLAPIKEEEVSLNPRIVLFKEALYNSEIEILKEIASPGFKSALVTQDGGGGGLLSSERIAQMSWLYMENNHPTIKTILQRSEDMIKLDTSTSEFFHVVKYGIGGHYKPHHDFFAGHTCNYMNAEHGDRIATLLYYMNDVEQGGATVFIDLNISVKPEKGTAIFWYNLLSDGNKDTTTLHAACPILAGDKWVLTKWLRERGQEFRRPCELKQ